MPLVALLVMKTGTQQVHSKMTENRKQFISLTFWIILTESVFPELKNFYFYGTTLALFLSTEMEACQEAGIALDCGNFCLQTLPKWCLTNSFSTQVYSVLCLAILFALNNIFSGVSGQAPLPVPLA